MAKKAGSSGRKPKQQVAKSPTPGSPTTKKRALSVQGTNEGPEMKKPKGDESPSQHCPDKETWQGWAEFESEPAYFSALWRDIGVKGIKFQELCMLDPPTIQSLDSPIIGLTLLFRYRDVNEDIQDCPPHVWFANQLPGANSCATLAMTQILMNLEASDDLDLGEHMLQFKEFTKDMNPRQRGQAFDSWQYVKKRHNQFAKKMDILEGDNYLAHKVRQAERQAKDKSRRASKDSPGSPESDDSAQNFENNAHHYIAFVPIGNEVWKLDGMDRQPVKVATFDADEGENWVLAAEGTITRIMAAGGTDYQIIAMTKEPMPLIHKKAALSINTKAHVEARLDDINSDWKAFTADEDPMTPTSLLFMAVQDELDANPLPDDLRAEIDAESITELLDRRAALIADWMQLTNEHGEELGRIGEEDKEAADRRVDYGPLIKSWLEMLAENGWLEQNLEGFMPKKTDN